MPKPKTSWGAVAEWYSDHLEQNPDTYQRQVILPNLLRLLELKKGERVLDLACGSGFFSREMAKTGAKVIGIDIANELIKLAKAKNKNIEYHVASADKLDFLSDQSVDKVVIILALQNIENIKSVFGEIKRVLKKSGHLLMVLNHPSFRVPGASNWGWDEERKVQYRRLDAYLSESRTAIQMHPGAAPDQKTWSFHRPLQYYFKLLNAAGFAVARLEEWISDKKSEPGPRATAENRARHEFPLFLCLVANSL